MDTSIVIVIVCIRLAAIDCVGGDTSVKAQNRLRHFPTAAPFPTVVFYSNTNNLVQLEDTTIKPEYGCSIQRTVQTTVTHHRSDFIYHVKRDDWQEEWGETDKTMAEEFQNQM